jgi:hypothetical protein
MGQYLYINTFLVGWTSIYQLFWGSLGTRVLTHPHIRNCMKCYEMLRFRSQKMENSCDLWGNSQGLESLGLFGTGFWDRFLVTWITKARRTHDRNKWPSGGKILFSMVDCEKKDVYGHSTEANFVFSNGARSQRPTWHRRSPWERRKNKLWSKVVPPILSEV